MRLRLLKVTLMFVGSATAAVGQLPPLKSVEWSKDEPRCYLFVVQDKIVRGCKVDGVDVSNLWSETSKKYLEFVVAVYNKSDAPFTFLRDQTLLVFTNKGERIEVRPSDPDKIAGDLMKSGRWGAFLGAFGAGMAQRTATVTDSQGNVATIQEPDDAARANAGTVAARRRAQNAAQADRVLDHALRSNTILPKGHVMGTLYFAIPKSFTSFDGLIIETGGQRFSFTFPRSNSTK